MGVKISEFVLQLMLLGQSLENGYPLVLIYVLAVIIVLNAVTCALMMWLKLLQRALVQVLADCL